MKNKIPIAVVGMAGMFPGAHDLPAFWHNIIHKIDSTSEVPKDRWIVEPEIMYHPVPEPDKAISKRACLIQQFEFDPEGLDLDRGILEALDPLYHIVLHTGREAFRGCVTSSIDKKRIGTILAAIVLPTDASSFIAREIFGRSFEEKLFGKSIGEFRPLTRNECLSSRVTSLPAAILARSLGLGGGSYTLDAACASSLYAVKLACDELISRRTDLMLAGGVSRPDNLYTQVGFSQLRALSPSGRCSPFDESADGLVVGEGAGILALKRFDDALRDGDEIFGLIRGMGLSNDLRGNLLAPDSEGQLRAMRRAYESAEWSPHDIDLIECHGTGTPAGDATELRSLRTLWGESGWSYNQCAIGSVKSMIGHLLTAAGAAGMIKTLLALKNKILPPSINFRKAPVGSPLLSSPFRVQTEAERWRRRDPKTPLHAAVSAFGFGGINAHLLFEEWDSSFVEDRGRGTEVRGQKTEDRRQGTEGRWKESVSVIQHPASSIQYPVPSPQPPIAIIGMESQFGSLATLRAFQEAVFRGDSIIRKRPHDRWKGCDEVAYRHLNGRLSDAGYMDEIMLNAGEFRIPPNEIPDILPQHLLMLKVAAGAMRDAGLPLREERPRMGSLIGIDFDFNATDFHLRWNLHNAVQKWKKHGSIDPEAMETDGWLESLRESMGEPLTPTRTLGALGGVIASRIAREFRLGGPSFGVSCEEASGLRALEIGIRSLQQNEMDVVLVGAIDLPGDVRRIITNDKLKPYAQTSEIRPFDAKADGCVPGEGAAAVVLKRLDQALKDGDRIYAVIKGIGNATGGGVDRSSPSREAYLLSMERAFQDAGLAASSIGYFEAHGSGDPIEDNIETKALHEFFSPQENPCAIGSVKSIIGHCGAAAGIASLVKTSLCLYHEIIPPLRNFIRSGNDVWETGAFHIPKFAQYWLRDRKFGPRRACIAAMTQDGNCMHAILEGFEYLSSDADALQGSLLEKVAQERKRPLGLKPYGLFIVEGDSKSSLIESLNGLNQFVKQQKNETENAELAARSWYLMNGIDTGKKYAVSIAVRDVSLIENYVETAKHAVSSDSSQRFNGQGGICYSPDPLFQAGETAFVFPGSGNHYVGMGREIGIQWPEILRAMDAETLQLKSQFLPHCYVPHRISWERGWEKSARQKVVADPLNMIFGQVVHGGMTSKLIMEFGIQPSAVIGYSLGESAGLFAMGAWPDRGEMLERILDTNLFRMELAGPCNAARQVWNVPPEEEVNWCVAAVNRPADTVRKVVDKWATTRLLIINTPNECVIGGRKNDVDAAIKALGCEAVYLEGVVTVHCDAALPAKDAYKKLHIFPTMPPEGIRFYSAAFGQPYQLTSENAASSILEQALSGFDFPMLIEQAYQDGIRMFLEMGPHASCTRMINRILENKPHLAVSASVRGEDEYITILKLLGTLIAERVPVDMDRLYGDKSYPTDIIKSRKDNAKNTLSIRIGGRTPSPAFPKTEDGGQRSEDGGQRSEDGGQRSEVRGQRAEDGGQRSEVRGRRSEVSGQRSEDGGQRTENGGQRSEVRGQRSEDGGQRSEDGRQWTEDSGQRSEDGGQRSEVSGQRSEVRGQRTEVRGQRAEDGRRRAELRLRIAESTGIESGFDSSEIPYAKLIQEMTENVEATADAHKAFLDFSDQLTKAYGKTLEFQTRLLEFGMQTEELKAVFPAGNGFPGISSIKTEGSPSIPERHPGDKKPVYTRDQCLEFAIGSVQNVLGPEFALVDTYKARVRLPDEPLMLVDRILSVEGEKASLSSGRVVTEHDVLPEAWYLDGDRAPVCISVEAGQADLFLCAYLGIDLIVKGERTYRLLDATVKFHRGLPRPGDVIQYEIEIEKFVRQGNTYLFFFNFKGAIGQSHLITMTNGCAGFFTEEEVRNSGGIILTEEDKKPLTGKRDSNWKDLVPMRVEGYEEGAVEALRNGDLVGCFGPLFDGIKLADSLRLPGGRMRLIDRVLLLDPNGGRYGLGVVRAEADIHPDDWFLTCHFMDDMVMPGTLMYECCAHALRVLIQRMGWVTDKPDVCYEPVIGVESVLKCRGPVTPKTRHVIYEVELKEIGYLPEPYVIADAHMYADGHRIVQFTDMSMKMTGGTREEIEEVWAEREARGKGQGAGGRRTEDRGQRSEVRGQRSEVRGQRSEDGGQRSEDGGQRSEGGGQRPEDRGQITEDRGRRTEDRGQRTEDRGRRTEDGGQRSEDGGQRSEDGGQRTEDRGRRTDNRGQITEDRGQRSEAGGQGSEDGGQKTGDRGRRTEAGGQRSEDRGQVTEDGGQRTEDRGRRAEVSRQDSESEIQQPVSSFQYPAPSIQHPVSSIQHPAPSIQHPISSTQYPVPSTQAPILFDREQILAFAVGNPSEAFGEPYRIFDQERFLARLPGPPYSFIDRVTRVEPEARVLRPDGWIEAEYDVSPDAWYFRANRMAVMPFCVLLEIGLQACGFLAAYLGSALKSEKDLKFRNLDGNAILHQEVIQKAETLTMRTRLKQASSAGDMIIEHFDMQILQNDSMIYEAETTFGFFTKEALSQQIGIRDVSQSLYKPTSKEIESGTSHRFEDVSPISPDDLSMDTAQPLAMPARALRMIDEIETYVPDGGPFGLGFIRGIKWVDPKEWFFKAHFYQDPVCPGSLGIESFLQLIKFVALARWGHLADSHRFAHITEEPHRWTYRGQIIPENKKIVIEAVVTRIEEKPIPMILADGFLKVDGLCIYKMENFGFQLVPI